VFGGARKRKEVAGDVEETMDEEAVTVGQVGQAVAGVMADVTENIVQEMAGTVEAEVMAEAEAVAGEIGVTVGAVMEAVEAGEAALLKEATTTMEWAETFNIIQVKAQSLPGC
jgi:hypothetical protein